MEGWYALVAFLVAFVLAQFWKFIGGFIRGGKGQRAMANFKTALGYMTQSGGMPSGHTASMVALTTFLGLAYGFDTGLFALAVASTSIVIYDAVHVRYAVGVQGRALNKLLKKNGEKELTAAEGHTPVQALVGAILGVIVGILVFTLAVK